MAGSYDAALSRMQGTDRASWKGSILYDGTLIQHYPMDASCWASGSPWANTAFDAFETEGAQPQMFTNAQLATWARIIEELSAAYGWTPARPINDTDLEATCYEHRECVRFGSSATACPDGRANWDVMLGGVPMTKDEADRLANVERQVASARGDLNALANAQDALPVQKGQLRYLWALAGKHWPF